MTQGWANWVPTESSGGRRHPSQRQRWHLPMPAIGHGRMVRVAAGGCQARRPPARRACAPDPQRILVLCYPGYSAGFSYEGQYCGSWNAWCRHAGSAHPILSSPCRGAELHTRSAALRCVPALSDLLHQTAGDTARRPAVHAQAEGVRHSSRSCHGTVPCARRSGYRTRIACRPVAPQGCDQRLGNPRP